MIDSNEDLEAREEIVLDDETAEKFEEMMTSNTKVSEKEEISYQHGIIHLAAAIASNFR